MLSSVARNLQYNLEFILENANWLLKKNQTRAQKGNKFSKSLIERRKRKDRIMIPEEHFMELNKAERDR